MQNKQPLLQWHDDSNFTLNGIDFRLIHWEGKEWNRASTPNAFVIAKPKWMLQRYLECINQLKPDKIVELGLKQGGSAVFFQQIASASKLVAIEIDNQCVQSLDEFIEERGLQENLVPYFGVNQADTRLMRKIIQEEFGNERIDLVVDDASHFLEESRVSFNILFPHLRHGGAYVIEDWPWAHDTLDNDDDWQAFWPEKEPLTKLVFELILSLPALPDLISRVEIDQNSVIIWRGTAPLDESDFDIKNCSLARGRNLITGNQ